MVLLLIHHNLRLRLKLITDSENRAVAEPQLCQVPLLPAETAAVYNVHIACPCGTASQSRDRPMPKHLIAQGAN